MLSRMNVAVIHHTSTMRPEPCLGDLSMFLDLLGRHPDVRYAVVAWDDPLVDWTSFTHFFLTSKVAYVSQFEDFLRWLDRLEATVDGLAARMFNPPDVVRWNSSKMYLKDLEGEGVRVPPTVWLESEDDLRTWDAGRLSGEVVVKNVVDASGISAWRCHLEEGRLPSWALEKLRDQLAVSSARDGTVVQAFVEDVLTEGEWSLMFFDGQFSHAVLKRPNLGVAGDFRVQQRHGGGFSPVKREDVPPAVEAFGEQVMASLRFSRPTLFARVDVICWRGTPYLMELELLDPYLFITRPEQADMLLQAFLRAAAEHELALKVTL